LWIINPKCIIYVIANKWRVNKEKVIQADVYELITPSKQRAYDLNKAYTHIVRTQSYIHGRDASIVSATNVHKTIDESKDPLFKG